MADRTWRVCQTCLRTFNSAPIFREDRAYCCDQCAADGFCTCLTEVDLADDGVDGLGLLFTVETSEQVGPVRAEVS